MAFDKAQLAQFSSINSYGLYRYDTTDVLTLVDDAGYMNNIDDSLNLAVGDMIEVFVWVTDVRTGTISTVCRLVVTAVNAATGAVTLTNQSAGTAFRGALAFGSSEASLVDGVPQDLAFGDEEYDTDNIHDTSVNNSRLTVPTGVTRVQLWCRIDGTGDESFPDFSLQLFKNATSVPRGGFNLNMEQTATTFKIMQISTVLEVVAGDFFEVRATQNGSSGSMNIDPQFGMIIWQ